MRGLIMFNAFTEFHFLRPEWFWALLPVVLILTCLRLEKKSQGDWQHIIPKHLLKHLLHEKQGSSSNAALSLLAILWLLSTIALAGPTWQKIPQPVYEKIAARVYVLDLSYSMYAADIKPNRIVRARLKLIDLLNSKREGLSALVVFSGDAHVVTPLTTDVNTISSLIPALEPKIMPNIGSNAKAGVLKALELLTNTQIENGEIILITDEVLLNDRQNINALMENKPYTLSIMSVGTSTGAPIKLPNGQFLKDNSGAIVMPKVNEPELEKLASDNGGRYVQLRQDDKDVRYLQKEKILAASNDSRESQQNFDLWLEAGQWLMFPILLFAAFSFRRGWLLAFLFCINMLPASDKLYANEQNQNNEQAPTIINQISDGWQALWLTPDQRGMASMQDQNFSAAAKQFTNQQWQAVAHYYNGQFAQASELFTPNEKSSKKEQADTFYNQGNALARAGHLDGAIAAYEKSLALVPDDEDTIFNKKLVEDLKEKQSKEPKKQNQEQKGQDQEQKDGDKNSENSDGQQSDQDSKQQSDEQSDKDSDEKSDNKNDSDKSSEQESESKEEKNGDESNPEEKNSDRESDENSSEAQEAAEGENSDNQEPSPLDREKQQAIEQWLREVPDDPSGLMRRKFELEHKRNKSNSNDQQQAW